VTKLAIFDCDGTLVDSGATIHRALSETFDRHGLEIPPARESRKVIGLSLTQAMAALLLAVVAAATAAFASAPAADPAPTAEQTAFYEDLFKKITQTPEYKEYMEKQALKPAFIVGGDRQVRSWAQALPRKSRLAPALPLPPDRGPTPVQALPVDGACSNGRCRRHSR